MKQRFTVVNGENEYTLGGYMRMKAREKQEKSNLPTTITSNTRSVALQSVLTYINKKLTIKEAPAPEKTIKAFPLRTALSAACSALLICTLMFSFGALNGLMPASEGGYIAQSEEMPEEIEEEIVAMNQ
jgi:hypothetical protein